MTRLLTLNLAGITREESVLLQNRTVLGVDLAQRAGDTHAGSLGLSLDTSANEVYGYIVTLGSLGYQQRLLNLVLKDVQREIDLKRFLVDCNVTLARLHEYASHSCLTATDGVYNFHSAYLISFNLIALGFCAA